MKGGKWKFWFAQVYILNNFAKPYQVKSPVILKASLDPKCLIQNVSVSKKHTTD